MFDNENIFKTLLDGIDVGVFIVDNTSRYLYVNDVYCKNTGKTPEFFYNTSILELKKLGYLSKSIWEIVMEKQAPVNAIITITDGAGNNPHDVLGSGFPHFNDNGEIDYVFYTEEPVSHINTKLLESLKFKDHLTFQTDNSNDIPGDMIAESPEMKAIISSLKPIIPTDATVLINGPSGSGKEVLANYIYRSSYRSDNPFIVLNCGAIPESLIESELFGYEKGSFTGALYQGKAGVIEMADHGTLFLDEINSMSMSVQTKLLRVLETKCIKRIGSAKEKKIDFRLICASNEDLNELVKEKRFRQDLLYRINVISVNIPPLNERKEDIIPLINLFTRHFCSKYGTIKFFDDKVLDRLVNYSWSGNIRELRNVVERLILTSLPTEPRISELPSDFSLSDENHEDKAAYITAENASSIDWDASDLSLKERVNEKEKEILRSALDHYKTPTAVAKALHIDLSNVYRKLNKYNLL